MNSNPVNLSHLARLVRDQMVNTCLHEVLTKSGADMPMLGRPMDPIKLGRLQSRIDPQGVRIETRGAQGFYCDLIQCSGNSFAFLTHLRVALWEAIKKGNADSFAIEENMQSRKGNSHEENNDGRVTGASIESLSLLNDIPAIICTLRLLGKFLGFIDSLPFRCHSEALSGVVLDSQVKLREQMLPKNLDLIRFLSEGLRAKRLIITLPWIIELCSAMDSISLRTKQFLRVIESIVDIYKVVLPTKSGLYKVDPHNAFLLKLLCGRLFENPLVPRELFFNDRDRALTSVEEMIGLAAEGGGIGSTGIDDKPVLSSDVIYACCPLLSELKRALSLFKSGSKAESGYLEGSQARKRKSTGRKKRMPLSKHDIISSSASSDSDINSILEKQFFHNQHERTKISVDLVSKCIRDKVSRAVEKHFLPSELEKMYSVIRDRVSAAVTVVKIGDEFDEREGEIVKQQLVREAVINMAAVSANAIRKATRARLVVETEEYKTHLYALLPDNSGQSVKEQLGRVAVWIASTKLKEWTRGFTEDFANKYERKMDKYWRLGREKGFLANSYGKLITLGPIRTPLRIKSVDQERIVLLDMTIATLLIDMKVKHIIILSVAVSVRGYAIRRNLCNLSIFPFFGKVDTYNSCRGNVV